MRTDPQFRATIEARRELFKSFGGGILVVLGLIVFFAILCSLPAGIPVIIVH